jgi:proteic killer suppression protein
VQVRFRKNRLQEAYQNNAEAVRHWGAQTARRYVQRVDVLQAAQSADDLFKIAPLKFDPLGAGRQGQYAITLHGKMRLIVSFTDPAMTVVWIEDVSDHYE